MAKLSSVAVRERTPAPLELLFAASFLTFIPFAHPRVEPLFWVALLTVVFALMFTRVSAWIALPLGIAALGAVLAPSWTDATVGDASRRAGAMDWAMWGLFALLFAPYLKERSREILMGLALVGAAHGVLAVVTGDTFAGRAVGLTANPGILGFWCMIGAVASLSFFHKGGATLFLACVLGLVVSETRAGMIALALIIPFATERQGRWTFFLMLGYLVVFIAVVLIGFNHPGANEQRLDMWRFVFENWSLIGHGFGSFALHYPGQDFPHSVPLQMLWDLGLIGAFLTGAFLFAGFGRLRGPWFALFVAFTVYSLFWFPSPAWFFVGALLLAQMRSSSHANGTAPLPVP